MTGQPTLLAVLLQGRGLYRYGGFIAAYQKAARSLDQELCGSVPSRAQFHRWLAGELRSLPHTDHCQVLEHMLAGYSAAQLFQACPDGTIPAPARVTLTGAGTVPQVLGLALPGSPGMA